MFISPSHKVWRPITLFCDSRESPTDKPRPEQYSSTVFQLRLVTVKEWLQREEGLAPNVGHHNQHTYTEQSLEIGNLLKQVIPHFSKVTYPFLYDMI